MRLRWLLFIAIWPSISLAANLGCVQGTVRDIDGSPLAKVKVVIQGRNDRVINESSTNEDGTFQFAQVPFGQYRVVATAPRPADSRRSRGVSSGEVTNVELFVTVNLPEQVITLKRNSHTSRALGPVRRVCSRSRPPACRPRKRTPASAATGSPRPASPSSSPPPGLGM